MKKKLLPLIFIAALLCVSITSAQEEIRVKCGSFVMNVPSSNVRCFQIDDNIPVSDQAAPEDLANAQIANTAISFSDYENINSGIAPEAVFYFVDDMSKTSFSFLDEMFSLSDIVNNFRSGDLTEDAISIPVPFLPYQAQEQTAAVLPKLIEFNNGAGLRTIIAFQDSLTANGSNSSVYYSWQGLSDDGNYYISVVIPVRSLSLDGKSAGSMDWQSFDGADLQPSLAQLDYYVQSIVIE